MYFRVEDVNGLSPNLRDYGSYNSYNKKENAYYADILIAQEIRDEVNNSNVRKVFSCSKSLGVVLFKYNYIADNPIHLIPLPANYVELDIVNENGTLENHFIPYDIRKLDYPIRKSFADKEIILRNYVIEVDNDMQLDEYLRNYTSVGKKKLAACEKDREVIIRHVVNYSTISEQHIPSVYLIYALQYRTGFLHDLWVMNSLIRIFSESIDNQNESNAFIQLVLYLNSNWTYEKNLSEKIVNEKRGEGRPVIGYDGYFLACDILNDYYEFARSDSANYIIHDDLLKYIYNIFDRWIYENKII